MFWQMQIETKCVMTMEKYKIIYRILIEMFVIWFIFEWNNQVVISNIANVYTLVSKKMKPLCVKGKEFFVFLSPYGREIIKNEVVFKWMHIFSIGLFIVLIIIFIAILLSSGERIYKIFIETIAGFIDWYALLLSAIIISNISQKNNLICWILAVFFFGLIQITIIGILSEEI